MAGDDLQLQSAVSGHWPAQWISHRHNVDVALQVSAFRRRFRLPRTTLVRVLTSADERYDLYVNGVLLGRGPERGDERNWFFETRDLDLPAGEHVIVARTWSHGRGGQAPLAQRSIRPGFLLAAQGEGITPEMLNTGHANWESMELGGYETRPFNDAWGTGSKLLVIGERVDWNFECGGGERWQAAAKIDPAYTSAAQDTGRGPWLRPALLPEMANQPRAGLIARHVADLPAPAEPFKVQITSTDHLPLEADAWNAMLAGGAPVRIPPHHCRRVIIDARTYVCAYPRVKISGGRGASVRLFWAESLTNSLPGPGQWIHNRDKGDRATIEGKYFWGFPYGVGDEFRPEGGQHRLFSTFWWEAGRYVEITLITGDDALTIESLELLETHYPYPFQATFESSEPRLAGVAEIGLHTLKMCSHETYMDCPYFEQLQYIGDTRLQALVTYVATPDARLPRKAVELFDASRDPSGLTQSRYPSSHFQRIGPFSLWWVAMVHDYALWRDEPAFVRARLPGVRAVLDAYSAHLTSDDLLGPVAGWNFVDWVPAWPGGMPKDARHGISGVLCWQYAWALRLAAQLEETFGEPELAALQHRRARELAAATTKRFFAPDRGAMADDLDHTSWSEHAQCLALLSGLLPTETAARVAAALTTLPDLHRTTIYFSHYLFDAMQLIGRAERILTSLGGWFDLLDRNLTTTVEMPEPTRSDCHAWGAHPVYHFHASILGVRPATFGFKAVTIRPQLGNLSFARGVTVHPLGLIRTDLRNENSKLRGAIQLPTGLRGRYVCDGADITLEPGINRV